MGSAQAEVAGPSWGSTVPLVGHLSHLSQVAMQLYSMYLVQYTAFVWVSEAHVARWSA